MSRSVRVCAVVLATLVGWVGFPHVAAAGTVSSTTATVTYGQVFRPWGDNRNYEPLPGGTADRALRTVGGWAEGWDAFRDAGFSVGGTPWDVWRSTEKTVVQLQGWGACARLNTWSNYIEDVRFFYQAPSRGAMLDVRIIAYDRLTGHQEQFDHRIHAPAAGWNVSPALVLDAQGRIGLWDIDIAFWSLGGTFLIDDVSIDPWRSRI